MKYVFLYLLLILTLFSCKVKINSDGVKRKSTKDSILFIGLHDTIKMPDSLVFISNINIKSPFQGWAENDTIHYRKLKKLAIKEAQKMGGNIVVVADYHNHFSSKYWSSKLSVQVYYLKKEFHDKFRLQIDSLKNLHKESIKNKVVVHLKNLCIKGNDLNLYFNDSLICHLKGADNKFKKKCQSLDFEFSHDGALRIEDVDNPNWFEKLTAEENPKRKSKNSDNFIEMKKGREYFLYTYTGSKHGYLENSNSFDKVSKEVYENELKK